ncbi:holo-ACP synthase [Ligilactobacillus sp. WILCCON 0076]|uniref:Holo-[acyl-carrier-protein] synthase n=1 Tax=Ligilactobacillus ubinensis TaxID=2876789 RepID=A0A9X2FJD7_9LACO|nr:holo-ACP synthase [Ligilactobacillus ubinensis]MCP0886837.1 holo-ACP synthase [Ligilactobacillus ubinensis]
MIYGVGVDIASIYRIKQAQEKNSNFARKILTKDEFDIFNQLGSKRKNEFLAGRFSIKEAYAKAFGTGIGSKVSFLDIEVLNDLSGKPIMTKQPCFDELRAHISISHTDELVMTEVILEKLREDE